MKYSLLLFCLLLSGCFSQLVKYSQPENSKYGEISFLEPEATDLRPENPVSITYIQSLSFANRSGYVSDSRRFFLSPGHYRAIVFCNRNLMPDGTPRKHEQIQFSFGPFEHVTFRIVQSQSYILDCYLIDEGRGSVFTITDTKSGAKRVLDITYDD